MQYKLKRNPRPFARPKYFLVPVSTAVPVAPAVEGHGHAPQEKEEAPRRREGALRDVRIADTARRPAQPAASVDAGAQGGRFSR